MDKRSFYFDPTASGAEVFLGPTEAKLMELAWKNGSITVKKALIFMGNDRTPAYTTVMTVLSRLAGKKLLAKSKQGRSFVYYPVVDRETFLKGRVEQVLNCMLREFSASL